MLKIRQDLSAGEPALRSNPDHAWKALSVVNEWIRHSDSKAAVTLAFTGVMAAVTFNLAHSNENRNAGFDAAVVIASSLLVVTAGLCGWTLTPRIKDRDADRDAINLIFFASISKNFRGRRVNYAAELDALTGDPAALLKHLADQVHANARIATVKAVTATWAIRAAFAAAAAVAVVAVILGSTNS